ncbi:MAG: class I SAM-dependent methyltransferase [Dechloromonas sp.]|nr:class I SAM-dependent methyltransferase [Dechloromonas sp.]
MSLYNRLLGTPFVYNYIRPLAVGGIDMSRVYARLGADRTSSILDVGCGTGDALRHIAHYQNYLGVDTDPIAVRYAQQLHGGRPQTRFAARLLGREDIAESSPTHVILAGLLHHLDDEECVALLAMVKVSPMLVRIVTQDIVYLPGAGINNFFASMDRGRHCRSPKAYGQLAEQAGLRVTSAEAILAHPRNLFGVRYWVMTLEPKL